MIDPLAVLDLSGYAENEDDQEMLHNVALAKAGRRSDIDKKGDLKHSENQHGSRPPI